DHDERDEGDAEEQRDGEQQSAEREEEHLAGGVPLDLLRHIPLNEIVEDPGRGGMNALNARGHHRQRIPEIEEDDRLVLGEDLLESVVVLDALLLVAGGASLLEQ